jgi:hypothetical protein
MFHNFIMGFVDIFKSTCFSFDKVIKLFTLSCLHPYMHNVFNGYRNLWNRTLDMVVPKWAHDLNIGFENLSF